MTKVNINEIKRDLPAILDLIEAGETLVLFKSGKPLAEIRPVTSVPAKSPRPFGLCTGEFIVTDDFDDPLPENIIAEFEDK